jgi:hypothetical protein
MGLAHHSQEPMVGKGSKKVSLFKRKLQTSASLSEKEFNPPTLAICSSILFLGRVRNFLTGCASMADLTQPRSTKVGG